MTKIVILLVSLGIFYLLVKNKLMGGKKTQEDVKAIDTTDMEKDPVCSTYVQQETPYKLKYYGKVYYFCSQQCLDKFKEERA